MDSMVQQPISNRSLMNISWFWISYNKMLICRMFICFIFKFVM